jgi:hypothetical protein
LIYPLEQLHRERQRQHNERRLAIGFHDQRIATIEPAIELSEARSTAFDLDGEHAVTDLKLKIVTGSVGAADLPRADQLGDSSFSSRALIA